MKTNHKPAIALTEVIATVAFLAVIAAGLHVAWSMILCLLNL
jgi:hypothetical protein